MARVHVAWLLALLQLLSTAFGFRPYRHRSQGLVRVSSSSGGAGGNGQEEVVESLSMGEELDKEKLNGVDSSTSELISRYLANSLAVATSHRETSCSSGAKLIAEARRSGASLLQTLKQPHGKDEAWRHMNMKSLFMYEYGQASLVQSTGSSAVSALEALVGAYIDDECKQSCLVFVDGRFSASMSKMTNIPKNVFASSYFQLPDAAATTATTTTPTSPQFSADEMLAGQFEALAVVPDKSELPRNSFASDVLTGVNLANLVDGAIIRVPPGVQVDTPIQVLFCSSMGEKTTSSSSYPRLFVEVGSNATMRLKQTFIGQSPSQSAAAAATPTAEASLVVSNTRVTLGIGANVQHTYEQDMPLTARHLEVLSSIVPAEANYDLSVLQMGAKIGRVNAHIDISGKHANCSLHGVTLAHTRQSLDLHSSITHDAEATQSRQQQRNVIGERGEAIFKGRIRIPKHAQLTDSDQLCRSLMLGERARVIAMPTLEIIADNVVCSHGASVADLDENSMFYLSARGVDRREARKLLLRGFVLELLQDSVCDKKAVQRIISKVERMNPAFDSGPGTRAQGASLVSM